jgi:glycosyltransferase involved in cell wall biosynthesis
MVSGSGAIIIHDRLAAAIPEYQVAPITPLFSLFPPLMQRFKKEADLVHTSPDFGPYLLPKNSPIVLTFHNFYLDKELMDYASAAQKVFYKTILSFCIEKSLKKASVLTAVSRFSADLVKQHFSFKQNLLVINNGVDHHKFKPFNNHRINDRVKILFAGNPTKRKGAHFLKYIAEALEDIAEVVVTKGLRNDKKKLKGIKFIERLPYQDMPKLYNDCDILLFPTFREGFGLVVAEAMACGLPVVTSNKSTMPELIHHGKGGFLTDFGDVDSMIYYLKLLIKNPVLRAEMGEYNRLRILDKYTEARMIKEYKELFSTYTS